MPENPDSAGPAPLARNRRRNPATPERPMDATALQQLAVLADGVKVLANQITGKTDETAENEADRSSRRKRKIQRFGVSDDRRAESAAVAEDAPDPEAAAGGPDATARNKSVAWPRLPRGDRAPVPVRAKRRRSTTLPLLVLMACNLVVLILGYCIGQYVLAGAASPPAGPPSGVLAKPIAPVDTLGPYGITNKGMEAVNAALKAEKSGDGKTARQMYDDAVQKRLGLPGAEYRLALLALQRRDLIDTDLHLVRSVDAGELVAPCFYVRATLAGARGDYADAAQQLDAAIHAEPFNAKYYFYRGECLRRDGNPRAAVDSLAAALDRAYTVEEGNLYFFKLGLAKIELGTDQDFNPSLASHLKHLPPLGEWLLLAAAQEIQRAKFPAAADYLQRASAALPAAVFDSRVRDYLFQTQSSQPDISVYLNHPSEPKTSEAGASIMDPASWSPEQGDPGTWPSAGLGRR